MNVITTEWEHYDQHRHGPLGGVYMFLFKDFRNAPYMAGSTIHFRRRADIARAGGFKRADYTFFRPSFISGAMNRTHEGFAQRWHSGRLQPSGLLNPELVYVGATSKNATIIDESVAFWHNSVVRLVCQAATANYEHEHIEGRVQHDIMAYYEGLMGHEINWHVDLNSRLVGAHPARCPRPTPEIRYSWTGGTPVGFVDFFAGLKNEARCVQLVAHGVLAGG